MNYSNLIKKEYQILSSLLLVELILRGSLASVHILFQSIKLTRPLCFGLVEVKHVDSATAVGQVL